MLSSIHGDDVYAHARKQIDTLDKAGSSFGINFPVKSPDGPKRLRAALDALEQKEHVRKTLKVVVTSAGSPNVFNRDIRSANLQHFHVVATVEHARKAVDAGCTGLIVEGNESGGHVLSPYGPTSMTLIPAVIDKVSVPVIAAGGFVDGKGLIAALALGAAGVQMGTRFYMTREASAFAPPQIQAALLKACVGDTAVVPSVFGPNRQWRNAHIDEVLKRVSRGQTLADMEDLKREGAQAHAAGQADRATVPIGMAVGRIDTVRSVGEVFDEIVSSARQTLEALARLR
jgi:NAD(P)H-dependent flavin oxidoreductase YrpB (nitropropane dioxygenase family)